MKICLAIGVAASRPLSNLLGAVTAAKEVGDWASKSGYRTTIITDERDPVTIPLLREVLEDLLPKNKIIESFVLHFAGHGFRDGAANNIWLQSDWYQEMRAISVEGLRQRLYQYSIKNLTIFSDACRSLPDKVDITQIVSDAILGRGPRPAEAPIIDRFNAVADGLPAYMVSSKSSAPRCVFSTVLIEGLWGQRNDAFDKYIQDRVTPESLDLFLKARMKEVGDRYRLSCLPENHAGTPRDHIIYYDKSIPLNGRPNAPEWPVPSFEQQMVADATIPTIDLKDAKQLKVVLGKDFAQCNIDVNIPIGRFQRGAQEAVRDLAAARIAVEKSDNSPLDRSEAERNLARARNRVEQLVVEKRRRQARIKIRRGFRIPDEGFKRGNLLVTGGEVKSVWSQRPAKTLPPDEHSYRFEVPAPESHSSQILVEFTDGHFASAIVYGRLTTVLSRSESGSVGWACVDHKNEPEWHKHLDASSRAVADLQLGDMSPEMVDILAANMREMKHVNPTLGAIAAYLYDYSGDVDSIRRMASFYCHYSQSIPFDIAFMGLMPLERDGSGWIALVPPVPARAHASRRSKLPEWVTQETLQARGRVGGFWPWLRQGWEYIDEPEDPEAAAAGTLKDLAQYLLPSQFTAFREDGASLLIRRFGMEENQ